MTTRTLVTADELLRMPDDGKRYELIEGELIEMAPAGSRHGEIAASVVIVLGHYVRKNDLGTIFAAETGFLLRYDPDTVRAPDAAYIAKNRLPREGVPFGFMDTIPDLVVEVVSPTTGRAGPGEDRAMDRARSEARLARIPRTAINHGVSFAERCPCPPRGRHPNRRSRAARLHVSGRRDILGPRRPFTKTRPTPSRRVPTPGCGCPASPRRCLRSPGLACGGWCGSRG